MDYVEIGLARLAAGALAAFADELAAAAGDHRLVLVHPPAFHDALEGLALALEAIGRTPGVYPDRVMVVGAEEHTLRKILAAGCWAGIRLGAWTSPERAVDMLEVAGPERLCLTVDGPGGTQISEAAPAFVAEMRRRGHPEALIERVVVENPVRFLSQSPTFRGRGLACAESSS